jgi:sugar phosphate permease
VNTAIMGNWFSAKNRGLVFGTWTCHQYIGNIIAAVVATAILSTTLPYWWALVIPAAANLAWGIVIWTSLPARPAEVGIDFGDVPVAKAGVATNKDSEQLPPISFVQVRALLCANIQLVAACCHCSLLA